MFHGEEEKTKYLNVQRSFHMSGASTLVPVEAIGRLGRKHPCRDERRTWLERAARWSVCYAGGESDKQRRALGWLPLCTHVCAIAWVAVGSNGRSAPRIHARHETSRARAHQL